MFCKLSTRTPFTALSTLTLYLTLRIAVVVGAWRSKEPKLSAPPNQVCSLILCLDSNKYVDGSVGQYKEAFVHQGLRQNWSPGAQYRNIGWRCFVLQALDLP